MPSLVGSEMCIRDRPPPNLAAPAGHGKWSGDAGTNHWAMEGSGPGSPYLRCVGDDPPGRGPSAPSSRGCCGESGSRPSAAPSSRGSLDTAADCGRVSGPRQQLSPLHRARTNGLRGWPPVQDAPHQRRPRSWLPGSRRHGEGHGGPAGALPLAWPWPFSATSWAWAWLGAAGPSAATASAATQWGCLPGARDHGRADGAPGQGAAGLRDWKAHPPGAPCGAGPAASSRPHPCRHR